MKLIILIILLASLPPLPVVRKFKKPAIIHGAEQLLFTSKLQAAIQPPRIIVIPFYYPSNFNTNSRYWDLLGSSNFTDWFIVDMKTYVITNGSLIVTNNKPQMFYRIISYQ